MEQKPAWLGHALSIVATCVSWCLSVNGAWDAQVGWSCALFIVMACLSEPSKFKANQILWSAGVSWHDRIVALLWYACCIALSVYLLHMPAERLKHQQEDAAAKQQAALVTSDSDRSASRADAQRAITDARHDLKRIEGEIAEASDQLQPGAPSLAAARARMSDRLSNTERKVAELDLQASLINDKLFMKVKRLNVELTDAKTKLNLETQKLDVLKTEMPGRPIGVNGPVDPIVHTDSIYIFAVMLELTISLGIWADGAYNQAIGREKMKEALVSKQNQVADSIVQAPEQPPERSEQTLNDFEKWLQLEWHSKKEPGGWLATTQRRMAEGANVSSSGAVHSMLRRLIDSGRVEKQVVGRKTYIRFVEPTMLRLVKR